MAIYLPYLVDAVSTRAATHRYQVRPNEALDLLEGTQNQGLTTLATGSCPSRASKERGFLAPAVRQSVARVVRPWFH